MNTATQHFFNRFVRYVSVILFSLAALGGCSEPEPVKNEATAATKTETPPTAKSANPTVVLTTNKGEVTLELFADKAPNTTKNFISYVNSGFYNNTVFHRVIKDFMIQGGGFDANMTQKPNNPPIQNEASPTVQNLRGTISMARTNDPHSASSQFFINVRDNFSLDKSSVNPGYAVFGKVIKGMEVVDAIALVNTGSFQHMQDVPSEQIILTAATVTP
jgi:cyclophilin family peptidyl-prolyl cis-trans isomerase